MCITLLNLFVLSCCPNLTGRACKVELDIESSKLICRICEQSLNRSDFRKKVEWDAPKCAACLCNLAQESQDMLCTCAKHMRKAHANCASAKLRSFALNLVSSFGFLQGQKEKKAYEQFLREREEEARTPLDSAGLRWTPLSLEIHWISIGFPLANWSRSSPLEQAGCETSRTARRNG
jgi:hypothetical protein